MKIEDYTCLKSYIQELFLQAAGRCSTSSLSTATLSSDAFKIELFRALEILAAKSSEKNLWTSPPEEKVIFPLILRKIEQDLEKRTVAINCTPKLHRQAIESYKGNVDIRVSKVDGIATQKNTPLQKRESDVPIKGTRMTLAEVISKASKITGIDSSWVPGLKWLVARESSYDPRAVNPKPVNGEHATGLMQTLPSTFNSYKVKGLDQITDPVHNMVAAIRYIKERYGHPNNIKNIGNQKAFKGY